MLLSSEGTLGIITKIATRLIPLPTHQSLLLIHFNSLEQAAQTIAATVQAGILPSVMEFMDESTLDAVYKFSGDVRPDNVKAVVLFEADGFSVEATSRWQGLPSVTGTCKPAVSPIAHLLAGTVDDGNFVPSVAESGDSLATHRFRKLLEEVGVQNLGKEGIGFATVPGLLVLAALAQRSPEGVDRAIAGLRSAVEIAGENDMYLHGAAAQLRLGKLIGGEQGDRLIADGTAWLKTQEAANPWRIIETVAPGFGSPD